MENRTAACPMQLVAYRLKGTTDRSGVFFRRLPEGTNAARNRHRHRHWNICMSLGITDAHNMDADVSSFRWQLATVRGLLRIGGKLLWKGNESLAGAIHDMTAATANEFVPTKPCSRRQNLFGTLAAPPAKLVGEMRGAHPPTERPTAMSENRSQTTNHCKQRVRTRLEAPPGLSIT